MGTTCCDEISLFLSSDKTHIKFFTGLNAITNIMNIHYHGEDIISRVVCITHVWVGYVSLGGNIINIMFIAMERTYAVFFPLKSLHLITTSKTKKVSWIITFTTLH